MKNLVLLFVIIFCGCKPQNGQPQLSPDYLQLIFSKIKTVDTTANILSFVSDGNKFQFLNKVIQAGSFDIEGPELIGEIMSCTEIDYDITQESSFDSLPGKVYSTTNFVYSNKQIVDKVFWDSSKNKITKAVYFNNLPEMVTTIDKQNNDTLKTRLTYDNDKLVRTKIYSNRGVLIIKEILIYTKSGNLEYQYITKGGKVDEFERSEYNNGLRQFFLARFDKNKKLLWVKLDEFDDRGNIIYQERFKEEDINRTFRKDKYVYNDKNEMTHGESFWPKKQLRMAYDFQYSKRDSLGNWTERISFIDGKANFITKRKIIYKRYK